MVMRRQRLVARRKTMGFSQEGLAERLDVDRTTIGRWESGETEPQPWIRPRLARLLQVSAERLDDLLSAGGPDDTEATERLEFALHHPTSVDLATATQLRCRVQQLDERYVSEPSTALLADAGQYLGQVRFLATHAHGGRVRRELSATEAESATLMGQLVWDASQRRDHATAHLYLDQAVHAARECRDTAAEGLALLRKTIVHLYGERDPRAALRQATRTVDAVASTSEVLTGLALLHAAEAHAMLGARSRCEAKLSEAETSLGQVGADDDAVELFSPSQLGRMAGSCYLFLSDYRRAHALLDDASRLLRDQSKARAIVVANQAVAAIRRGEADEAITYLHQAIDVIEVNWGAGALNIVFGAGRELRRWRDKPEVQDVQDRLMNLMAAR